MAGKNSTRRARRKIPVEACQRLQKEFRIALRGMSAKDVFRKFDKDKSGDLSSEELIRLVRHRLRITPDTVSDDDIEAVVAALDDDGTSSISIDELLDFVERGTAAFHSGPPLLPPPPAVACEVREKPAAKYAWLQGELLEGRGNAATAVAHVDTVSPEICNYLIAAMGMDPAALYANFFGLPISAHSVHVMPEEIQPQLSRSPSKRPPISEEVSHRLQVQLKGATLLKPMEAILKKFDKDHNGTLSAEELKRLVRLELRLPDTILSDKDIHALVTALDDNGSVSIEELLDFVERGSASFFTHGSVTAPSFPPSPRASVSPRKSGHLPASNNEVAVHPVIGDAPAAPNIRKASSIDTGARRRTVKKRTSDWDGAVVVFPVKDDMVCTTPDAQPKFPTEVPSHVVTPPRRPASADMEWGRRMSPAVTRPHSAAARTSTGKWPRPDSAGVQAQRDRWLPRPHSAAAQTGGWSVLPCAPVTARPVSAVGHNMRRAHTPTSPFASRPVSARTSPLQNRTTRPVSAANKRPWA